MAGRGRAVVLALAAAGVVFAGGAAIAVRARHARESARLIQAAQLPADPVTGGSGAPIGAGEHIDELPDLLRRARGNPGLLIEAYAAWARAPRAQDARRVLVGAMASLPLPAVRLTTLLAAVEASPLPPAADPSTPDVVAAVSALWQGDFMRRGRDLLFIDQGKRPRSHEVVFESFVALALSDRGSALEGAQRNALASDFIDLYARATPDQRPQILAVVRKLGGADTADFLSGEGLHGAAAAARHAKYLQEIERAKAAAGLR